MKKEVLRCFKRMPDKEGRGSQTVAILMKLLLFTLLLNSGCSKKEMELPEQQQKQARVLKSVSDIPDFTIAVIPDIQYYTSSQNGGTPAMFTAQMDWIKANQAAWNIVYVASLGDISDHGDTYANEWTNASTYGFYKLESQAGFPDGIPYGTCVGNHDQTPNTGHPLTCSTTSYNNTFGANRFRPRSYYGESYYGSGSNNNDSHYDLITVGTAPNFVNLIIIYIEYDNYGDDWEGMHQWAQNLLSTYSDRKGIIISHNMMNAGVGTAFNPQGASIYNKVKYRENCFLMLGGHTGPTGRRADTYTGNTINTVMSDYQFQDNGGSGYMRLMKFKMASNEIEVKTYSPYLNLWASEGDINNTFTLPMFSEPYESPIILNPVEDAFVRDGSYGNTNYGSLPNLTIKAGGTGYSRKAFLKFDVSSISTVTSAKLRVYGSNIESSAGVTIKSYYANTDAWSEGTITWNNCPAATPIGALGGVTNKQKYYEWDVTAYVQAQVAGDNIVSLVLHENAGTNLTTDWHSREGSNKPQLIITRWQL